MKELAPIVLFVYNRPKHTGETLQALKKNNLADKSTLYIYCDGARPGASKETLQDIAKVRKLVKSEKWCGEVHIIESDRNKGLSASIRDGVTEIIGKYGKIIVMEDDLRTSPSFLNYMNSALEFYRERASVFSIAGYNLPKHMMKIPVDYGYDVYASPRNGSWGWATWIDRWEKVDWSVEAYSKMEQDEFMQKAFNRGGNDMFNMLRDQQSGRLNIWSIQFTVAHFVNHAVAIVPTHSFVDNLGLDGSGDNSGVHSNMRHKELCIKDKFDFLDIIYQDERLVNAYYSVNSGVTRPFYQKVIRRICRIVGIKEPFEIKAKVYS